MERRPRTKAITVAIKGFITDNYSHLHQEVGSMNTYGKALSISVALFFAILIAADWAAGGIGPIADAASAFSDIFSQFRLPF